MRSRVAAIAAVAALSLVLTACGSADASEPGKSLTEAPSASQGHSVGDVVDEKTAEGLGTFSTDKNGAYEMPDGTFIVVHSDKPLPEAVRADMARRVSELMPVTDASDTDAAQGSYDEFARLASRLSEDSGKSVIIFTLAVDPTVGYPRWLHFGGQVSERIPAAADLPGNERSLAEYEDLVFAKSQRGFFEVFYR